MNIAIKDITKENIQEYTTQRLKGTGLSLSKETLSLTAKKFGPRFTLTAVCKKLFMFTFDENIFKNIVEQTKDPKIVKRWVIQNRVHI